MPYVRVAKPIREPRPIGDGVCEIELTRNFVGLISESDAPLVAKCSWCVSYNGKNDIPYVKGRPFGDRRFVRLHRYLLDFPAGQVDHINHNTLDNRRENLRVVTQSENMANTRWVRGSVRLKGVCKRGIWYSATITKDKQQHVLGLYATAIAAAKAYDAKAIELYGSFACTNASLGLLDAYLIQSEAS